MKREGRLAQLARATRLHRVGQGFESLNAHQLFSIKDIQIIYESKYYLIVNKPAGLLVHKDKQNLETETLSDILLKEYPEIEGVGEPLKFEDGTEIKKSGIVHRLDKDTSGLIIIPRNQKTFEYFKDLFKSRKIEKTYHAFIYENIKDDEFSINEPIGRSKSNFKQRQAGKKARGKMREAETYFKVLKRSENKKYTLLEAKPKTGRTHQIRVHLKHIYKPIVADKIYAPKRKNDLGFERLALHSYKIKFETPDKKVVEFEAPYPLDFKNAYDKLLLL